MTEPTPTQGGTANRQGKVLERTIIPTFEARGFEIVKYSDWKKKRDTYSSEILLKHVPYTTIYGHQGYTEFLAQSQQYSLNHRIECKWQQSSGSVDEKFPYLYLNCIEAMPEPNIIIIAGRGGMKEGAIPWLKRVVLERPYLPDGAANKNIQVFSIEEFILWANQTLK
ncbi:PD-(D/E)XK nuclease superfamily protein [Myxosarcina sp. GI1(2024)]